VSNAIIVCGVPMIDAKYPKLKSKIWTRLIIASLAFPKIDQQYKGCDKYD
jgi:hypothetical protein